jgi:hypothetical protein
MTPKRPRDPAIVEPADPPGIGPTTAFEPVQPMRPAIREALSEGGHDDAPAPARRPKMPF